MGKVEKALTVFPYRLKQARTLVGISQERLGVAAGLDEYSASARMNQYERGVHMPDFGTAVRLAEALKIPVSFLYEPDDKLAELILLAGMLPAEDRDALLQTAKDFLPR